MVTISAFEMSIDEHHRQTERVNRLGWLREEARSSQSIRASNKAEAATHVVAHPRAIATLLLTLIVLCATVLV
jgi:hypothetical protein